MNILIDERFNLQPFEGCILSVSRMTPDIHIRNRLLVPHFHRSSYYASTPHLTTGLSTVAPTVFVF